MNTMRTGLFAAHHARMSRPAGRRLLAVLLLSSVASLLPLGAAHADERPTEIIWAHPTPERVGRFVVLVSATGEMNESTRWIEVGEISGESTGTMSFFTAVVPMDQLDLVAVAAIGLDGSTVTSEWSPVPPSRPGQPLVVEP